MKRSYTPQELLRAAAEALDCHPDEQTFSFHHPVDAYATAAMTLETVTGMLVAEYDANRGL